jgi:membrane-associated phospholipid phosphatase
MKTSSDKKKPPKKTSVPEQKIGDTPVAPWDMPTPEEKAQAKPARNALKEAVKQVDSPEKADEVIEKLESAAKGQTVKEVRDGETAAATPSDAAQKVQGAARSARKGKKPEAVLEETARVIAASDGRSKEVIAEAAQEVLNPQQQGAELPEVDENKRKYLREAVLKRLRPLDALDASLFLAINHMRHTRFLNGVFYAITVAWNGATVWYAEMVMRALWNRRAVKRIWWGVGFPLTVTGLLVELPIKSFFRRRRPFISMIQAIVIGKKPGTWSFPSGHAAGAFAGAWLLNQISPRFAPVRYVLAALVGFSRIYLGDHYPGDVASGSLIGLLFAMIFRRLAGRKGK